MRRDDVALGLALGLAIALAGCGRSGGGSLPARGGPAAPAAVEAIRVTLTWDAPHGIATARVESSPPSEDAAFDESLRTAAEQWKLRHSGEPHITLHAERGVPWKDVVETVNACSRLGLKQVDFEFEGREGK